MILFRPLVSLPLPGTMSDYRCRLAVELGGERIRVNCVVPGWVETEMTSLDAQSMTPEQLEVLRQRHPLGFGRPEDVAHAVAFMLADTGRWMPGTTLVIDDGFSIR